MVHRLYFVVFMAFFISLPLMAQPVVEMLLLVIWTNGLIAR